MQVSKSSFFLKKLDCKVMALQSFLLCVDKKDTHLYPLRRKESKTVSILKRVGKIGNILDNPEKMSKIPLPIQSFPAVLHGME